jgi:hypothetical protein
MSIVAPSVNPFHNVAQRRSCGAYTTTTVIPTPRPVSARGTPRMGRPTPEPLIVLGSRPEGRDAPAITSRRSSVSMPRYRENWNDTSEARDGIASEGRGRSSDARPHRIVIGSTSLRRPLRPESAKSVVRARVPVIGVEAPSAQGAAAVATKMRREQLSASTSRPRPSTAVSTVRVPGATRLTQEHRNRALKIMLQEDRDAAAFAAAAESFNPQAVNARERRRERQVYVERVEAARQELMWAQVRRDHTDAKMEELRLRLADGTDGGPPGAAEDAGSGARTAAPTPQPDEDSQDEVM